MKTLFLLLFLNLSIFANESVKFFKADRDNYVLCRAGYETYVMLSTANASVEMINGTPYFRYKQKDYYFPASGCNPVKERDQGLIY